MAEKKKNKGGRPSKYKKEFCKKILDFFSIEPNYERDGKLHANKLPALYKFAESIKVNQDTLHEWAKNHKEFSEALKLAKEKQKWFLVENGLNGVYNSNFAKFVAINVTDMEDTSKTELSGEGFKVVISKDHADL